MFNKKEIQRLKDEIEDLKKVICEQKDIIDKISPVGKTDRTLQPPAKD